MLETYTDRALLTRLEARVDQGLRGTEDALDALLEIQRRQLFKLVATDFWEYCRQRWPSGERHIRRLLAAVEVVNTVAPEADPNGDLGQSSPSVRKPNERQARELARLPKDAQAEVWTALVHNCEADEQRITAKVVEKAVDDYLAAVSGEEPSAEEVARAEEQARRRSLEDGRKRAVATIQNKVAGIRKAVGRLDAGEQEMVEQWLAGIPDFLRSN